MLYESLAELINNGKEAEAREIFFILVEKDYLWRNSFVITKKKEKQPEYAWADLMKAFERYRKPVLNYAFFFFCFLLKNKSLKVENNYLKGTIVNLIRIAKREYGKEFIKPKAVQSFVDISKREIAQAVENILVMEYEDYLDGINPFLDMRHEDRLLKDDRLQLVKRNLEAMGNPCKELITCVVMYNWSHEEILEISLRYTTVESTRAKLSQCMNKLREMCKK